jgi:hypothetical protein
MYSGGSRRLVSEEAGYRGGQGERKRVCHDSPDRGAAVKGSHGGVESGYHGPVRQGLAGTFAVSVYTRYTAVRLQAFSLEDSKGENSIRANKERP